MDRSRRNGAKSGRALRAGAVIDPMYGGSHVLWEDGGDGTSACSADQRDAVRPALPGGGTGPRRAAARQPHPGQARRHNGQPRGWATPAAGAEMNRETRMANVESEPLAD